MRLKDAVASLRKEHTDDKLIPLYTPWGEKIREEDIENVWQEYPRPGMVRDNYTMLNGKWKYAIFPAVSALAPGQPIPADGQILVPFSPESLLSGVQRQLKPDECLWYERTVAFSGEDLARKAGKQRCILHFGAVDQHACVYANGRKIASHTGGYLPFCCDVTRYVGDTPLLLQVCVRDLSDTSWYSRGKQTLKRGGMFYTAQSGIWQSVWYEWTAKNAVRSLMITPDADKGEVTITLDAKEKFSTVSWTVYQAADYSEASFADRECGGKVFDDNAEESGLTEDAPKVLEGVSVRRMAADSNTFVITLPQDAVRLWTPGTPFLYRFTVSADEDVVHGYFAFRSFTVEKDAEGVLRFCLNHKPYFLHGLLDQGYWPDGLMTAPCDEAFVYDIKLAKESNFNMLRKHIKIEPLRWYYHCDRMGMIVWQDMVSGGTTYHMPLVCYLPTVFPHIAVHTKDSHYRLFSRSSVKGRLAWEKECLDTVGHLYSVPSIAAWIPFNEGWGQFDAARIAKLIKEKDATRPVDHASGWFDQKGGDFKSVHNYFRRLTVRLDGRRAFVISEYGGYACYIEGNSAAKHVYGYRKFDTPKQLTKAYGKLLKDRLFPLIGKGLSAAVYTQLSDVEEEVNGLVTYDRRVVKIDLRQDV